MPKTNINNIDSQISTLFPNFIRTCRIDPTQVYEDIYPQEWVFIKKAVEKRKQEFIAGRICAKTLLKQFEISNFPVLVGENREPLWPEGIVGSIAHTQNYCAAAIGKSSDVQGMGLDIEQLGRLTEKTWRQIATEEELEFIQSLEQDEKDRFITLLFSAKESFYKLQYPLTKIWVNFHDVLFSSTEKNQFTIELKIDVNQEFVQGKIFNGKFFFQAGYVFTGIAL